MGDVDGACKNTNGCMKQVAVPLKEGAVYDIDNLYGLVNIYKDIDIYLDVCGKIIMPGHREQRIFKGINCNASSFIFLKVQLYPQHRLENLFEKQRRLIMLLGWVSKTIS